MFGLISSKGTTGMRPEMGQKQAHFAFETMGDEKPIAEEHEEKKEEDPKTEHPESESESESESEYSDAGQPEIEWPSTVIVIGKKFSGKTNLALDIIDPDEFDEIYIFTASKHTGNLDSLVQDKRQIFDSCSDRLLKHILEKQEKAYKAAKKGKKRGHVPNVLLLWDDFLGMHFNHNTSPALKMLASSGRNFNISMWVSSQDRVGIHPLVRRNAEYWFLGNNTVKVINDLADEMAMANMGRIQMKEVLSKISRDKDHEFLFLDDRNQTDMVYKADEVM